ncbi:hypothetical protein ACFXAZ_34435 [Streptomyces sp. NPDC059477]|uniref:hypothetical protein n=1 Tax=Streptomyces sp. NPDC059477 TaxID=3346847 RepID=UPI0036893F89
MTAPMDFIRYRVEDSNGEFIDEFTTNSPDFADERIERLRTFYPRLVVTETDDED